MNPKTYTEFIDTLGADIKVILKRISNSDEATEGISSEKKDMLVTFSEYIKSAYNVLDDIKNHTSVWEMPIVISASKFDPGALREFANKSPRQIATLNPGRNIPTAHSFVDNDDWHALALKLSYLVEVEVDVHSGDTIEDAIDTITTKLEETTLFTLSSRTIKGIQSAIEELESPDYKPDPKIRPSKYAYKGPELWAAMLYRLRKRDRKQYDDYKDRIQSSWITKMDKSELPVYYVMSVNKTIILVSLDGVSWSTYPAQPTKIENVEIRTIGELEELIDSANINLR